MNGAMLLLDLDGVVVFEVGPPLAAARELLLLHEDLGASLAGLGVPVVVLTHRSRREAHCILHAARFAPPVASGLIAAEDLFIAGIRHAPVRMLGRGLRKDLVLPVLERRFGVARSRIAFIDDRLDNLEDLLRAGLGLAIHAPSALTDHGQMLHTFDIADAVAALRAWDAGSRRNPIVSLPPRDLLVAPWRRTGLSTAAQNRHLFNTARRVGRALRLGAVARPARGG